MGYSCTNWPEKISAVEREDEEGKQEASSNFVFSILLIVSSCSRILELGIRFLFLFFLVLEFEGSQRGSVKTPSQNPPNPPPVLWVILSVYFPLGPDLPQKTHTSKSLDEQKPKQKSLNEPRVKYRRYSREMSDWPTARQRLDIKFQAGLGLRAGPGKRGSEVRRRNLWWR